MGESQYPNTSNLLLVEPKSISVAAVPPPKPLARVPSLGHFASNRKIHLDLARGVAALAVCAGHLRAFQFVTFSQLQSPTVLDQVFYLVTGYGHQAVMIFFVLSGYFIAGSVADTVEKGKWSWSGYASRRLTRLWLVLIPALLLTLFWDRLGQALTGGRGYDGCFAASISSGPAPASPVALGWRDLLGNVAFLQTIHCPVFGTDGPLWSLANEFWYYALFPLGFLVLKPVTAWGRRLGFLGCIGLIVWLLPKDILTGFAIWLLGYGVHRVMRWQTGVQVAASRPAFAACSAAFLATLLLVRRDSSLAGSLLLGLTFAGTLPFLISHQPHSRWYCWLASAISEISYTLYLVHFPLLAFFFFSFRLPGKSLPGVASYSGFLGLLALTLIYAVCVWWLFEKRTDSVRKRVERALRLRA